MLDGNLWSRTRGSSSIPTTWGKSRAGPRASILGVSRDKNFFTVWGGVLSGPWAFSTVDWVDAGICFQLMGISFWIEREETRTSRKSRTCRVEFLGLRRPCDCQH